MNEASLLGAAEEGSSAAFAAALEPHLPRLYALLLRMTGDRSAAEDLAQETALRAFQNIGSFRGEASFYTWLYRIAANLCLRHLEMERPSSFERWPPVPGGVDGAAVREPSPEERYLIGEVRVGCLTGLVRCLPREQRIVFVLAVLLGMPLSEVALVADCSVDAAKARISRARKALSDFVERRCQWIDAENRCRCRHFVQYSLERGLIARPTGPVAPPSLEAEHLEEEIDRLQRVVRLYECLPQPATPDTLAERIRRGLANREWTVLS